MLYRILTVRRHKTVTFCDAYSFSSYRQQLVFYHNLVDCSQLSSGCTVNLTCHPGKNKRGLDVFYVDGIHKVFLPQNSTAYKGFQKKDENQAAQLHVLAQDLNGGIHLRRQRFRLMFMDRMKSLLKERRLIETNTPITEPNRGTSTVSPVLAIGQYTGDRYIKITHELGLKMQSYLLLAPLYEVGYVMRDRYQTKRGLNEYLTLEGVVPCDMTFDLTQFYLDVLAMSKQLAAELELEYDPIFDEVKVLDISEGYHKEYTAWSAEEYQSYYEKVLSDHPHCIAVNAPMDSPLGIAGAEGVVMETKWVLEGHGLGHGYQDEYRPDILRNAFAEQQRSLLEKSIASDFPEEFLTVCEYAGIPTYSFNLGVDRYLACFFGAKWE